MSPGRSAALLLALLPLASLPARAGEELSSGSEAAVAAVPALPAPTSGISVPSLAVLDPAVPDPAIANPAIPAAQVQALPQVPAAWAQAQAAAPQAQVAEAAPSAADQPSEGQVARAGARFDGVAARPAPEAVAVGPASAAPPLRLHEALNLGVHSIPFLAGSALAAYHLQGTGWHAPVLGAAAALTGRGLAGLLGDFRAVVVGGWQASHDQKYRYDYNGRYRDIRGRRYGEDRYDEFARGQVSARQRLGLEAVAGAAGLAFLRLSGGSWTEALTYGVVASALLALAALWSLRRPAPPLPEPQPHQR